MLSNQAERLDADTGTDGENGHENCGARAIERPRLALRVPVSEMDVTGVVPMAGLVRGRRARSAAKASVEPSWPPPPRPRIVFRRDETADANS